MAPKVPEGSMVQANLSEFGDYEERWLDMAFSRWRRWAVQVSVKVYVEPVLFQEL